MTTLPPLVSLEPGAERPAVERTWDPDSLVLMVALRESSDSDDGPATLAETIDAMHRIDKDQPRILIGDMEIDLDRHSRLRLFSIRTNPGLWESTRLPAPTDAAPSLASFDVDCDPNRIASYDAPLHIRHDRTAGELAFSFGSSAAVQWGRLASDLFVAVSMDGRLCELRLAGVKIPLPSS
jgi:hypothetical protein